MNFYFKVFFISLVIFGALDFIWLGFIMKNFNNEQLSGIARMVDGQIVPRKLPTLLTYLTMALALTCFAAPKIMTEDPLLIFGWGALLGFCCYAIFDFTNWAILKEYHGLFVFADIAWGTFLFGVTNTILYFIRDRLI